MPYARRRPLRTAAACTALATAALLTTALLTTAPPTAAAAPAPVARATSDRVAPGGPGGPTIWTPADKHGFGTARERSSHVWFTLREGELSEVFYPDLGTPALRDLEFVVTDGRHAETTTGAHTSTRVGDPRSLTFTQTDTGRTGRWRMTRTYVTDPRRSTVLVDVGLRSLDGRGYRVYAVADPALSNNGDDDSASVSGDGLTARDADSAVTLAASTGFAARSVGYLGTSDGRTDLLADGRLDHEYRSAGPGNVVLTGRIAHLDGRRGHDHATLALGFGARTDDASAAAGRSLHDGFRSVAQDYARGWHAYLAGLKGVPASARGIAAEYNTSVLVLAASEDKVHPGAFVASPTMPWAWGQEIEGLSKPSEAYHLVWSRDLYQHATALIAAGDSAAANRAVDFLFFRQQKADGSFPQNSRVDGTPQWTNLQLDEVSFPLVLAWQLHRRDAATYAHVKRAADFLVHFVDPQTGQPAPFSPQERWENQSGYAPGTIAAEIAGLICAADLAKDRGDTASATRWRSTAIRWASHVDGWTVTHTGPYSSGPYYLRLTKDGHPDSGTAYDLGDGGPTLDQRAVVDPSFLELVRLGIKPATDPVIRNSVSVVDSQLAARTTNGTFWHRYNGDGYGETRDGAPWNITPSHSNLTIGRIWPIFAGERGEYELLSGSGDSRARLRSVAAAANDGGMIAEQVWDDNPPAGRPAFPPGEGTMSATPLTWSHAVLVRLAWSIDAGRPVEQPAVVACTFHTACP